MNTDYFYLASPYSKDELGLEHAHMVVCVYAAKLINAGVPVYSPIAHSHSIAKHGKLDPKNHNLWIPLDEPMMHHAAGLIVLCVEGWGDSIGVSLEIDAFARMEKMIWYWRPRKTNFKLMMDHLKKFIE